jgi:nitrite reductase/ring-hydroxylating ferredoxin subunit
MVGDVPPGEMRSFQVEGEDVAIANLDGDFVAFGDVCTHQQCSLAEGDLDDTTVICPCHGSEFDVRTGEVLGGPATENEPTFDVLVENDEVKVAL